MDGSGEGKVTALLERIRASGRGKTCGWTALDQRDVNFHPGELTIIAGRTGHGKTTVILNLLLHWLEKYPEERFILYSYEVPDESVYVKLISALTRKNGVNGWTYSDIRLWLQTGSIGARAKGTRFSLKGRKWPIVVLICVTIVGVLLFLAQDARTLVVLALVRLIARRR